MDYEDDILVETETEIETQENDDIKPHKDESKGDAFKNFPKYSNEKLERVYSKYDFSKSYNPSAHKKESESFEKFVKENNKDTIVEESFTFEKTNEESVLVPQKSSGVFKICGIIVCALLIILSMINLATITELEQKIENEQQTSNELEVNVGKLIQDVGKLTDKDELLDKAQNSGMVNVEEEIKITLNEKQKVLKYNSKTNLFDQICNFISSIFGG